MPARAPCPDRVDPALRHAWIREAIAFARVDARPAYLSAGTLLGEPANGYGATKTYADIAEVGRWIGARDTAEAMFKRFLINSFLRNTNDHLRKNGLIQEDSSWRLSPVFDVVPSIGRDGHVCAPRPDLSPDWDPPSAFGAHQALGLQGRD